MKFKSIHFKIPGQPMSKQRPRMTKAGHIYMPEQTINYENIVKTIFVQSNTKNIYWDVEPVRIHIVAVFNIPKSYSKTRIELCKNGMLSPSNKDCDNIGKIVCDALNSIAYNDDKQIVQLKVNKIWGDKPCVEVFISTNIYSNDTLQDEIKSKTELYKKWGAEYE